MLRFELQSDECDVIRPQRSTAPLSQDATFRLQRGPLRKLRLEPSVYTNRLAIELTGSDA
jgi:hypothetical protein